MILRSDFQKRGVLVAVFRLSTTECTQYGSQAHPSKISRILSTALRNRIPAEPLQKTWRGWTPFWTLREVARREGHLTIRDTRSRSPESIHEFIPPSEIGICYGLCPPSPEELSSKKRTSVFSPARGTVDWKKSSIIFRWFSLGISRKLALKISSKPFQEFQITPTASHHRLLARMAHITLPFITTFPSRETVSGKLRNTMKSSPPPFRGTFSQHQLRKAVKKFCCLLPVPSQHFPPETSKQLLLGTCRVQPWKSVADIFDIWCGKPWKSASELPHSPFVLELCCQWP